jgi:hypothetical protein
MTNAASSSQESQFREIYGRALKEHLKRRWSENFLREVRPKIRVDLQYNAMSMTWYASCLIGGPGEYCYKNQMRIEEGVVEGDGHLNQHHEWMQYHSENMMRLAETGIFLKWFERKLDPNYRRGFNDIHGLIDEVSLIPSDPHSKMVDESWLAVVKFNEPFGKYRQTMRNIAEDPKAFLAMMAMVKK